MSKKAKTISDTKTETQKEKAGKKKKSVLDGIFGGSGNVPLAPLSELNERENLYFIDTGSHVMNALISGSLFGGVPSDCVSVLAGETSTGKTYIAMTVAKNFLDTYPEGTVVYFDTEHAVKQGMPKDRGIDESRFRLSRIDTVEELQRQILNILKDISELSEEDQQSFKLLFILDSLGNLSTQKEEAEGLKAADKKKKDMTRAQLFRSVFRTTSNKLGNLNIPLLLTNHVSVVMDGRQKPGAPPKKRMCLVDGTQIRTEIGTAPIDNTMVGDMLPTASGIDDVINTFQFESEDVYEIEFEDGTVVQCTGEHRFLGETLEWIQTNELLNNSVVLAV